MEKNYTRDELSQVFSYDPDIGIIRWRISPRLNVHAGSIAGSRSSSGYRVIFYQSCKFSAHRLAWFLYHGEWPKDKLDHENRIRDDNRIKNLREATRGENKWNSPVQRNNSHGSKGVTWDHQKKRWCARIKVRGKRIILGRFRTREEAFAAYKDGAVKHAGEFACWSGDLSPWGSH